MAQKDGERGGGGWKREPRTGGAGGKSGKYHNGGRGRTGGEGKGAGSLRWGPEKEGNRWHSKLRGHSNSKLEKVVDNRASTRAY